MVTITLDTNCINARQKDESLNTLESLHKEGKISIVKTDVMDTEMQANYSPGLKKSEPLDEDIGIMVLGHSRLGHGILGEDNDDHTLTDILSIIFGEKERGDYSQNELRDAMMIETHMKNGRTFLVTNDGELLEAAKRVKDKFDIAIVNPSECLSRISTMNAQS